MKLTKAIEILQLEQTVEFTGFIVDFNEAIKLGIEALKRVQSQRYSIPTRSISLLKGETKED